MALSRGQPKGLFRNSESRYDEVHNLAGISVPQGFNLGGVPYGHRYLLNINHSMFYVSSKRHKVELWSC